MWFWMVLGEPSGAGSAKGRAGHPPGNSKGGEKGSLKSLFLGASEIRQLLKHRLGECRSALGTALERALESTWQNNEKRIRKGMGLGGKHMVKSCRFLFSRIQINRINGSKLIPQSYYRGGAVLPLTLIYHAGFVQPPKWQCAHFFIV